jgi:lysozyme
MIDRKRSAIAGIVLSASALVGIAVHEGYSDTAYTPVPGDVATIGFGRTADVKPGKTTVQRELIALLADMEGRKAAIAGCVTVPLHQHELSAYMSLVYNIGTRAFCNSTLVKRLNAGDYAGACQAILMWDRFKGKPLRGLTIRRQAEYKECMGDPS